MTCVRKAWLTLGPARVDLEDPAGGWVCTELDLGYPEVRDVTNNRPDADGIDDGTRYFGARAVSANLTTTAAAPYPDTIPGLFAPFLVPSARPVLHYVLDRGPDSPERTLSVRAADFAWPLTGSRTRQLQLSFVAADPIARAAATTTVTAWAGASTSPGRTYNLTFDRIYPPGGGAPVPGLIINRGDVALRPLLRIYGPITAPDVSFTLPTGLGGTTSHVRFVAGFTIGSGSWVDVDTATRTAVANSDPTMSVATSIDWLASTWPAIPPGPDEPAWSTTMRLAGASTTSTTQVQAIWQDGYLT